MNIVNDWEKQILTAQDIARIFKCGKNLAYKIIESDDMNAVRIGSTIRVSMKSFNEWIDNKGFLLNNEETFDNQVYTLEEIKDILKIGRNSSYNQWLPLHALQSLPSCELPQADNVLLLSHLKA